MQETRGKRQDARNKMQAFCPYVLMSNFNRELRE